MNKIICGNNLEVLKTMEDNSIDSIVSDPPYELGFMGKKWDSTGIAYNVELWKECLRVLKPGGHLLAFSGTRTYHRMACAIENAGFDIRDIISWLYGSGFPKSHNVGKSVNALETKDFSHHKGSMMGKETTEDNKTQTTTISVTKGNSQYEGWGTALKPANEPICLARKPLSEKTVAENVLKWGTGGINIDGCRVEGKLDGDPNRFSKTDGGWGVKEFHKEPVVRNEGRFPANLILDGSEEVVSKFPDSGKSTSSKGHFRKGNVVGDERTPTGAGQFGDGAWVAGSLHNDSGSASRFFYCAKASKAERNKGLEGFEEKFTPASEFRPNHMEKTLEGKGGNPYGRWTPVKNNHPTVKPVKLMRYLCRLITPKGGTILDPFMGSGSTGIGAKLEGFNFIGIELDPEYCKIAETRIKEQIQQQTLI